MSSGTPFIFQLAEALSSLSVPIGGGLALYAKWRRGAERDRRAREETARVAAERAAISARKEEQALRDALITAKDEQIKFLQEELDHARQQITRLTGEGK